MLRLAALDKSDFPVAVKEILETDAETLDVERVSIWTVVKNPSSIRRDFGFIRSAHAWEGERMLPESAAPNYFRALETNPVIVAHDAQADARTRGLADYLEPLGITSMMDVPVWIAGKLCAVLCHEHVGEKRQWTENERIFALSVGAIISAALEARGRRRAEELLEQREGSLRRGHERFRLLVQALKLVVNPLEPDKTVASIADVVVPELADAAMVDAASHEGEPHRVAVVGFDSLGRVPRELYGPWKLDPSVPCGSIQVFETGLPQIVGDLAQVGADDPCAQFLAGLAERGFWSFMCVPVTRRGRTLATISFLGREPNRYGRDDLTLAMDLALRVGLALENAFLYQEAQHAIRSREDLMAIVSHDLRNPLSSILLLARHLAAEQTQRQPERVSSHAVNILRAAERMDHLIGALVDMSQMDAGVLRVTIAPIDVTELLADVAESMRPLAEQRSLRLDCRALEPALHAQGDRERVVQVLVNLIDNALKFAPPGTLVTVIAEGLKDTIRFSVRDMGPGIPEDAQPKLFERYYRIQRTGRPYEGTGLGLYIVKRLVLAQGGEVGVDSKSGAGSCFYFTLPRTDESEP